MAARVSFQPRNGNERAMILAAMGPRLHVDRPGEERSFKVARFRRERSGYGLGYRGWRPGQRVGVDMTVCRGGSSQLLGSSEPELASVLSRARETLRT